MCTQWPQGFPLHLVPPLVGDMKHKADGVTEATSTPSITLCPNSSGVSTSQRLSFGASFSYTVPFPARRTLRETTHWLCSVGISRTTCHQLNPAQSLPQAQRRAGVTQPPPEEPNPGLEPSCKALPSGVGPAPPPHPYPPTMVVRGCVGMARSWAERDGGAGHCVQWWPWVQEGYPKIDINRPTKWGCSTGLVVPSFTGKAVITRVGSGG